MNSLLHFTSFHPCQFSWSPSLIANPSGPTGHMIPKKADSVVTPSLWSDSQGSFDTCLSVKTRFFTPLLSTLPLHFLSFIPFWHLLLLLSCLLSSVLLLFLLFLPFLCPFFRHHLILLFSLISASFRALLNSSILSFLLLFIALVDLLTSPRPLQFNTGLHTHTHTRTHPGIKFKLIIY